jgi:hypothetical protein
MATTVSDANRDPAGYQQLTSLATATALTVPAGADVAIIQAEAQAVRWRDDGTDPTSSVGMRLAAGSDFLYTGRLSALRFIQDDAVPPAILNVSYYE